MCPRYVQHSIHRHTHTHTLTHHMHTHSHHMHTHNLIPTLVGGSWAVPGTAVLTSRSAGVTCWMSPLGGSGNE